MQTGLTTTVLDPVADSLKAGEVSLIHKLGLMYKIIQGLTELHEAGVIHGDLKPDNILLSSKDLSQTEIRLADFGFAEIREKYVGIGESSLIETIHQRGTPVYSAPEQLYDPAQSKSSIEMIKVAKPSEKTDIYSFAILSWEILTQMKPFNNITSSVELSIQVHQGTRPDINLLPKDCSLAIRDMIERCWDSKRENRLSALKCRTILRESYFLLTTMECDVYLMYKCNGSNEILVHRIRNKLIDHGFKVAWMYDISNELNEQDAMNQRYELIKHSRVILLCLDMATQNDNHITLQLGNNRGFKHPRPVIPMFLELRKKNFPDKEIQVHCILGNPETKIFDISNCIENPLYTTSNQCLKDQMKVSNNTIDSSNSNNIKTSTLSHQIDVDPIGAVINPIGVDPFGISPIGVDQVGVGVNPIGVDPIGINPTCVDPIDLELYDLINYIHTRINNLCII